jgi:hypothetical protein
VPDTIRPISEGQKAGESEIKVDVRRPYQKPAIFDRRLLSLRSLLLPVNVVAKLRVEALDVETKHAVHAQLAKLTGISGSEGILFFGGEIVFRHDRLEIREGSLHA